VSRRGACDRWSFSCRSVGAIKNLEATSDRRLASARLLNCVKSPFNDSAAESFWAIDFCGFFGGDSDRALQANDALDPFAVTLNLSIHCHFTAPSP
jgi:hypothetical protein